MPAGVGPRPAKRDRAVLAVMLVGLAIQAYGVVARAYVLALVGALVGVAGLGLHAMRARRERRRRKRFFAGRCVDCGYDLRGLRGQCPECGRRFKTGRKFAP